MKIIPYSLPIGITLIFIISVYLQQFWIGAILLPLATLANSRLGQFSQQEAIEEYEFFHHDQRMASFKAVSGIFFVLFNFWILYYLYVTDLTILQMVLFTYSIIILNSNFAISLAHDLMHARKRTDRALSTILLLANGFYYLESDHLYIHHRYVGTKGDPASAYPNESLYHYLVRSITKRIRLIFGNGDCFPPSKKNQIVRGNLLRFTACFGYLIILYMLSFKLFICIFIQFIFVTLIYEIITYIQHYALRRKDYEGKIEEMRLAHSWNCYYKLSAYLYFMMPMHSIHHLKSEPELATLKTAGPNFPHPFGQMVLIALFPQKWFKQMDQRAMEVVNASKQ